VQRLHWRGRFGLRIRRVPQGGAAQHPAQWGCMEAGADDLQEEAIEGCMTLFDDHVQGCSGFRFSPRYQRKPRAKMAVRSGKPSE